MTYITNKIVEKQFFFKIAQRLKPVHFMLRCLFVNFLCSLQLVMLVSIPEVKHLHGISKIFTDKMSKYSSKQCGQKKQRVGIMDG